MADQQGKRQGDQQGKRQGERQGESMVARTSREDERGLAPRQYQDPFALMDWMLERMQRDLFGPSVLGALVPPQLGEVEREMVRVPRMRVRDAGDAIVVTAELPGLDPNDLKIELQEDVLTIHGESRQEQESEGRRAERQVSYFRQVRLPEDLDADQVQASCEHGVVTIRFPRRAERQNVRQIPISAASREKQPKEGKEQAA